MGSRMVEKIILGGHTVSVWNRSPEPVSELQFAVHRPEYKDLQQNLMVSTSIENLVASLSTPRVIWLMLPAGSVTEEKISEVASFVEEGDIIVDGGNSFYKDTERRSRELSSKGIRFLGIGVSGGVLARENGYPLMVGGDKSAYSEIKPVLDSLAKPNGGYEYFGEGGAGHFVKMVHNGIEYGMMQAIGEGFGVLEKSEYNFSLFEVAKLWQKNTIVSSFLIDRAADALGKDEKLENVSGVVAASGEGAWTVEQAKELGVPIGNIEQALNFRIKSKKDTKVSESFAARMVSALRHEFGGHDVSKEKKVDKEDRKL